jgi:hypothetical protein
MKKVAGIMLAMFLAGIVLSGCYTRACEQPPAPVAYKGEG